MPKAVKPIYVNEEEGVVGETKKAAGQSGAVKSGSQMSGAVRVLPAAFAYEDAAHQREKLRARMKEEEDRLTDEISEGLDNVTRLASQHLSQRYPQLAKKETLDETDKEEEAEVGAEALPVAEKVHTLSYRSSVLVSRTNGIDATDDDDQTQKQDKITANQEATESEDHHEDDGEHTYANLGVTFVHLTEKMKSVVSQMSSAGNGHCEEENKYSRLSDGETADGKALDGDGLPYIDEAASASGKESSPSDSGGDGGSGAALDDAIATASGLDRSQVVDRVELSSQAEATPVELVTQQRRTDEETDTGVQQSQTSRGRVVIVRSDLGEV